MLCFSTMSLMQICGEMNSNLNIEEKLNETLLMNCHSGDLIETQFSVLDYYPSSGSESCLPNFLFQSCPHSSTL